MKQMADKVDLAIDRIELLYIVEILLHAGLLSEYEYHKAVEKLRDYVID